MKPPKILIVEDEQIIAFDLERNLMQLGYDVVGTASRTDEAVRLTGETCPDLVLMDIQLEGKEDGVVAAAEIRRKWHIPIVFLTGNGNDSILDRAKAVNPLGYIGKPFTKTELSASIAVALQQDRTARHLFTENDWLTTLLASLSDGVIATDLDAVVRFVNPVAERLTGWALEDAEGRPIEEVYPLLTPEGQPIPLCQLRRALATQQPVPRERFLLVNRANSRLIVEDGAAPIRNAAGDVVGAATVFLDATERLRAEQERERVLAEFARSNQELTRFSYAVSHDLQAPVRTVRSLTELLVRRNPERWDEEDRKVLTMVTQAAGGMQHLIQSLLKYAQAGQGRIQRERVPLAKALDAVEITLGALIAETHAQIVRGSLPVIEADRTQLEQLIQNLVCNAIRYRRPEDRPVIEITGSRTDDGWELQIRDNGQGIPRAAQEEIFEPLKRLHGQDVPGSGLGLALCRTIVQRHGGQIWAESEGVGRGSTFNVTLRDADIVHPA